MRKYNEYFTVTDDYCPVMTSAEINKTPDRWLDFYPHTEFEDICKTLLSVLVRGDRSLWITGNYGTGKSNAALVIQKLFVDDESRVRKWLQAYDANGLTDRANLEKDLFSRRNAGTLVVYDFNAVGVGPNEDLLVRLEKCIIAVLKERNMIIPALSNLDSVIARLRREGAHFFTTRDAIQGQLAYLHAGIKTVEQLVDQLNKELKSADAPSYLLDDVQQVFRKDNIYLDVNVATFRTWLKKVLDTNKLENVVYLFDEFHPFIEANKEQLKTFEDITESPGVNRFFIVPVTHMGINAYLAEGSSSAKKANDRFYFRQLKMPNDTAFRLAKHAMKDTVLIDEWKKEKDHLWGSVSSVVQKFNALQDPGRERFYDILPIHPMAAFLLKFLSESAKSNQRSFFEYLKGSADGKEFQDFIRTGGPEVANKQFLTVDYLWSYFINRNDLGLSNDIVEIGLTYKQIRDREFSNQSEDAVELRVLKTVLLFCLLDKLSPDGHDRLKPTVENVELSFKGDGSVADPAGIVRNLENRHCFSVVNGNISLFSASPISPVDIAKYEGQFHELLSDKVKTVLEEHTKSYRQFSSGRFDIRVSDASHSTLTNITKSTRDKYSEGLSTDDASICLWFVIAKNKEEQLAIPQKIESILRQLHDHRIIMFTFPTLAFCHDNVGLWDEFVRHYARYMTENDGVAKEQIKKSLESIEKEWFVELKKHTTLLKVYQYKNELIDISDTSWSVFKDLITGYARRSLPVCLDYLGEQISAMSITGLKGWALAGIRFSGASQQGQLVGRFRSSGISDSEDWFAQNTEHPLSMIHAFFEKKFANTVGKGGQQSIRRAYIELQRAPYGLRYNALSAFVLGFCLRGIMKKNYQWTNGQMTKPLTDEILAEIIETVVKDDGADRIKGEKLICRLSKEDKTFIEKAPLMFGITPVADATVESVLAQIQLHIEKNSNKVPLWSLPKYIDTTNDDKADVIKSVLDNICMAFTTSSKGRTEERTNAIHEVGAAILADLTLVNVISEYIKPENFVRAFELYVDIESSELAELAVSIGDISHDYCRSILAKVAETAGWLWKEADISKEINDMICEYKVISLAKSMCGFVDFVPYKNVFDAFRTAVIQTNRLPKSMLESAHPSLSNFLSVLHGHGSATDIEIALSQSAGTIEKLFFDTTKVESLKILKNHLRNISLDDSELLGIMNTISGGFGLDETTFLDSLRTKIEEHAKQSVSQSLKTEWHRLSKMATPSEWSIDNRMPARILLSKRLHSEDMLKAIESPEMFSASRLTELLEILKDVTTINVSDCQAAFVSETIPQQYAKFNISLALLLDFMHGKFGSQPNNWPPHPDITEFIRKQYKGTIAPQIKEKIRDKDPEQLKQKIIQLADENPELGLIFWED